MNKSFRGDVKLKPLPTNKAGTSKVGAISKAQKSTKFLNLLKGDPFDFSKIQSVAKYQKN